MSVNKTIAQKFKRYSLEVLRSDVYKELSGATIILGTRSGPTGATLYFHKETSILNKKAAPFFYVARGTGPIILSWENLAYDWVAFISGSETLNEACFKVFWDKLLHPPQVVLKEPC